MKQRLGLLLSIMGVVLLSFFAGRYFYQRNLSEMRVLADTCLVRTLENELEEKQKQLDIPYSSSRTGIDTAWLAIRITTAEGTKTFKVNPEKSKKNISQSSIARGMHSCICEESPLYPDSLNALWRKALQAHEMNVETFVRIAVTDFHGKVSRSVSKDVASAASLSSLAFTAYVGNCCEIEVRGIVYYSLWQVVCFHWYPYLWILVGAIMLFSISYYVYWLVNRPVEVVIREVTRFVQSVDLTVSAVYELSPGFLFDAKRQMLMMDHKKINIPPQSCVILKLFLDAPEYTLSDNQIIESVWSGDKTADIRRFSAASSHLSSLLRKQGLFIQFKRVGSMKYRLILLEEVNDQ